VSQGRSGQARKIRPLPRFDLRTVHPVASRYTHFLSSAEVKNEWSYTSTPTRVFMVWYLVTHRDGFTSDSSFEK